MELSELDEWAGRILKQSFFSQFSPLFGRREVQEQAVQVSTRGLISPVESEEWLAVVRKPVFRQEAGCDATVDVQHEMGRRCALRDALQRVCGLPGSAMLGYGVGVID